MLDDGYDFIKDKNLYNKVLDSISFISTLWVLAEKTPRHHKEELYRTIILYNASIIEALLLYYCTQKGLVFEELKYTHASKLSNVFQKTDSEIVIAFQVKKKKEDYAITFADLLGELKLFLGKRLVNSISELKEIRNTFHLSKARKPIDRINAEKSNAILLKLVQKIKNSLR